MRGSSAPPVVVAITGARMRFAGGVDDLSALHAAWCEVRELHSPMPFTRFDADVLFAPGVWIPFLCNTNHAIFRYLWYCRVGCRLLDVGCACCVQCVACYALSSVLCVCVATQCTVFISLKHYIYFPC